MAEEINKKALGILLLDIYYAPNIESWGDVTPENIRYIKERFGLDKYQEVKSALQWMSENPGSNLKELPPNIPLSNEEIYSLLMKMYRNLSRAEVVENR